MRQFSALTIPDLSEAIQQWETSANRQLVTWIGHSQCWTDEIPSAVAFLCGAFPHAQPPGFNPIIISDTSSGMSEFNIFVRKYFESSKIRGIIIEILKIYHKYAHIYFSNFIFKNSEKYKCAERKL